MIEKDEAELLADIRFALRGLDPWRRSAVLFRVKSTPARWWNT
jgi:hypothetical protein